MNTCRVIYARYVDSNLNSTIGSFVARNDTTPGQCALNCAALPGQCTTL